MSPPPLRKNIEVHGHRGSRGTHPENTMLAFEESVVAGADFFELDVQLTKDFIPVVYHDPILWRHCTRIDGKQPKSAAPLSEIHSSELAGFLIGGAPMPLLESVLKWAASRRARVNIEMKMDAKPSPDPVVMAQVVLNLVKKYKLLHQVLLQSFDMGPLQAIRKAEPSASLSCLFEAVTDFVGVAKKVGAQTIGPFHPLVTQDGVEEATRCGIRVIPWTVNTEKDWQGCIGMGVCGIITDYPRKLVEFLRMQSLNG